MNGGNINRGIFWKNTLHKKHISICILYCENTHSLHLELYEQYLFVGLSSVRPLTVLLMRCRWWIYSKVKQCVISHYLSLLLNSNVLYSVCLILPQGWCRLLVSTALTCPRGVDDTGCRNWHSAFQSLHRAHWCPSLLYLCCR